MSLQERLSFFLLEASKREQIDTGDAIELIADARDAMLDVERQVAQALNMLNHPSQFKPAAARSVLSSAIHKLRFKS